MHFQRVSQKLAACYTRGVDYEMDEINELQPVLLMEQDSLNFVLFWYLSGRGVPYLVWLSKLDRFQPGVNKYSTLVYACTPLDTNTWMNKLDANVLLPLVEEIANDE